MSLIEKFSDSLVFESLLPGLEVHMPIIPAKEFKRKWLESARAELKEMKKQEPNEVAHIARCPGIFDIARTGWVLRSWLDIEIETNGDLDTFLWRTPVCQNEMCPMAGNAVEWHPQEQFSKFQENFPSNTLKTIIKIQTPWRILIPKGYNVLVIPVPYSDESRFTVLPGTFYAGIAVCNLQMLWHVTNGKTVIKAGTPLAQFILIPENQPEATVRSVEDMLPHRLHNLKLSSVFNRTYEK
jgi:hypothetical protein